MYSLWTEADQKTLAELVRKRGFADVAIGLREIANRRVDNPQIGGKADWNKIGGLLTRIYDNIAEKRPLD